MIVLGWCLDWNWTRSFWFRWGHLATVSVIILQSWLGELCPLTVWEQRLRQLAGVEAYSGSFVAHWLHKIMFWEAPHWLFLTIYTLFGAAVLLSFLYYPPRSH